MSKYEVSSMELMLTVIAAGRSRMLVQSMLLNQVNLFKSSKLATRFNSGVIKLQEYIMKMSFNQRHRFVHSVSSRDPNGNFRNTD